MPAQDSDELMIFLESSAITLDWHGPNTSNSYRFSSGLKSLVTIDDSLGVQAFSGEVGGRIVHASAAVHRVNLTPEWRCPTPELSGPHLLYDGSIAIYGTDHIPKTDFRGPHLERQGRIWYVTPLEGTAPGQRAFEQLLRGPSNDAAEQEAHVAAVLRGYQHQEDRRHAAKDSIYKIRPSARPTELDDVMRDFRLGRL